MENRADDAVSLYVERGLTRRLTLQGQSAISIEDFAVAMLDEIEKPQFLNKRFTVGY